MVTLSYNQGRFLPDALRSVVLSKPGRLKYVVVDAGSLDNSRSLILAEEARVFARIFEPDAGPADGLNKGFALLDTDVLGFLNADDFYLPGALDYVLETFGERKDIDVLTGALVVVDESGEPRRGLLPSPFSARAYLEGWGRVLQQSTFFSRRVWEKGVRFNPDNRTCWDGEFLVDAALAGASFDTTSRPLAAFRLHAASITGSGRLVAAYWGDQDRILARIRATGIRASGLAPLKRVVSRMNLLRRAREYFLLPLDNPRDRDGRARP